VIEGEVTIYRLSSLSNIALTLRHHTILPLRLRFVMERWSGAEGWTVIFQERGVTEGRTEHHLDSIVFEQKRYKSTYLDRS